MLMRSTIVLELFHGTSRIKYAQTTYVAIQSRTAHPSLSRLAVKNDMVDQEMGRLYDGSVNYFKRNHIPL